MNIVSEAINAFENGRLIALPTETVYGLAAPINKPDLLAKIFSLKERPFFDPLIIHVADAQMARRWVSGWPKAAQLLAEQFWPGPLSLVLPKHTDVNPLITSGLSTVAVRCPDHAMALELIKGLDIPLAAPSANKFSKTSPTRADHVSREFSPLDVTVFDGGPCQVGIESTIVKIEEDAVFILRQGMVTIDHIKTALRDLPLTISLYQGQKIEAPGQVEHHYMPPIPLVKIPNQNLSRFQQELSLRFKLGANGVMLELSPDPRMAARELYNQLRVLSQSGADFIAWSEEKMQESFDSIKWDAIKDRLNRASRFQL